LSILLSEWVEWQTDRRIANIASRGIKLKRAEIRNTLESMGHVMSLNKLHRKIAIMYVVLGMEEGESMGTTAIVALANKVIRSNATVTTDMTAAILRLIIKWGYLEVLYGHCRSYRRTSK
jgi:hypothetical protein